MIISVDFREVFDFTRYELLGHLHLPTPAEFNDSSEDEKNETYERAWSAIMNACQYMTAVLNIDEVQAQYK